MAWYDTEITCPKCFTKHTDKELVDSTAYSCWSGEEVQVQCPTCEFDFEVQCDFAGWEPSSNFDMQSFRKAHNIVYPEKGNRIFIDHYLTNFVEDGTAKMHQDDTDRYGHNLAWAESFIIAKEIWERIKASTTKKEEEEGDIV